jgi:RNA polymerase sigma-70 factor (ECF subfamily)
MTGDGSPDARVEVVYRSIHPRLWRALVAYTMDPEMASDAEAEAFAQVLRRGDAVVDVDAWVWRSAFAISAAMLAERSRQRPLAAAPEEVADPERSALEFDGLLYGLSGQQRACVILRYVCGMDTLAIAAALSTSTATVRVQLHRARAVLRRTLKEVRHG